MKYFTAAEFSKKWDISCRMAAYYCEKGRITGALKKERYGSSLKILKNRQIKGLQKTDL